MMTVKAEAGCTDRTGALADLAGKYLTFMLGGEEYGIEILKVQEIIGMMPVTTVPRTPAYIKGVINLRGRVIPVVDLRLKFEMDVRAETERTCIIIVRVSIASGHVTMGLVADDVSEVHDIRESELEPAPVFGGNIDTTFILAIGKVGSKVVMLLDVDRVLSPGEVETAAGIAAPEQPDL